MKHDYTAVILAGGRSTRLNGKNKAFIHVGGKTTFEHIYTILHDLFKNIIVVTNEPDKYLNWDCEIVTDIYPIRGSLIGLHSGLFYTKTAHTFFTACDTPFLKKEMIIMLLNEIDANVDVVIPEISLGFEPLCAVYSKRCLKPIEQQLAQHQFKIQSFFHGVRVKKIPEKVLLQKDPGLISFFNINTPEDILKAEDIARGGGQRSIS